MMRETLRSAVLLTTLLAAGCVAGPDFKAPETPAVSQYVSRDENHETVLDGGPGASAQTLQVGQQVQLDWWRLFQSPDLDGVVEQALNSNHTLDSAKARLEQARESVNSASTAFYPEVSVGAAASRQKLNAAGFPAFLRAGLNTSSSGTTASVAIMRSL